MTIEKHYSDVNEFRYFQTKIYASFWSRAI